VTHDIEVVSGGKVLGPQTFRLVAPGIAFKVTALPEDSNLFEIHARKLLEHTRLDAIQWINVARKEVSFRTIRR
jgi:hypothetical protein